MFRVAPFPVRLIVPMILRAAATHAAALVFLAGLGSEISAQTVTPPNRGGLTPSMGIPPRVQLWAGFSAGVHRRDGSEAASYVTGSLYRDVLNPAVAALGLNLDVYGGRRGSFDSWSDGWDWGARLGLFSPVTRLAFGWDYNGTDREADFFLSVITPLRRGGILVDGGALRIDYLPGRNHSTNIGFSLPVGQKFAGRTRARSDYARIPRAETPVIPEPFEPRVQEALDNVEQLSMWVTKLTIPFIDDWDGDWERSTELFTQQMVALNTYLASDPEPLYRGPRTPENETRALHRELERLFSMTTSGRDLAIGESTPLGVQVWDRAREIILSQLILPYNRLLGQKRKNDSTVGFAADASAAFYEWLSTETPIPENRLTATGSAFQGVLNAIESVRAAEEDHWGDARFVFLPFQLVLKPEDHDEQSELDAILERAVAQRLQNGNLVNYVENELFQYEFGAMVLEAKNYSVLLVHDFRGYAEPGRPDEVAYRQSLNYLRALINAVNAYGETGKIPQHILLVDQWYFQANGGALFARLLENPLHHHLKLPRGYEEWEAEVERTQEELRAAVAGSRLLQAQARLFPDGWIENVVKIHVNITNPADVSFWTSEVIPLIGLPDMVGRDHRKIAFADISEEDPYSGRAMFTGMGIGEHYVGAGWEDRALIVRGPAILGLKYAARDVLLAQGFGEDEIPFELQPRPLAPDYDAQIQAFDQAHRESVRAMQVHNRLGYAQKDVNLLKATLYTLMPSGSVIKAPDSIWNLPLWGSMMLGNSLRGGRSLVIAPSIEHAPSSGFPQMSRSQELMGRLILAASIFDDYLQRTGGLMKVGLYSPDADVGNVPARMRQLAATLGNTPWLADLYDFVPGTVAALRSDADSLDAAGYNRRYAIEHEIVAPKMHLKAHFFASSRAWEGLTDGPEMLEFLRTFYRASAEQNRAISEGRLNEAAAALLTAQLVDPGFAVLNAHRAELPQDALEKDIFYLTVGSHNQNFHSFAQAAEVAMVVARYGSLHGLPDFITLAGLCQWVDSLEELEELFPRYEGMRRRLSHWMRIAV